MTALFYTPDYDDQINSKRVFAAALLALSAREERVIRLYFGFNGPSITLKDIADHFNVTMGRLQQIHAKALRKLRMFLKTRRARRPDVSGAGNFGLATPRASQPERDRRPFYKGPHWRLLPFIYEMHANGSSVNAIRRRLLRDYRAATWLNKSYGPADYVPRVSDIEHILGCRH